MPRYKLSDYVVRFLAAQGVTHVYEVAGGMVAHLLDSFSKSGLVRLVSTHHEQGAGFAAEGHARITGVPGVAMATSGPGATNLLTAIGSCYFDSTPAVFITGQVNRNEIKGSRPIRQLGFQETDIVSMARPITKLAFQVASPDEITGALHHAFRTALEGRRGPVLVDLPMDVQRGEMDAAEPERIPSRTIDPRRVRAADVDAALRMLREAARPLVLIGGGVRSARATEPVRAAIERMGIPAVLSLLGADVLGHEHPLRVGMIGSYGNRWANHAVGRCDALLVLGSRLDIRQTGTDTAGFGGRPIVHVDVDAGEINNRVQVARAVVADVGDFCAAILDAEPGQADRRAWRDEIAALRARWPDTSELKDLSGLNPNGFLRALGEASSDAAAFVVDVGQHQMWAGQSLAFHGGQRFVTSGGMGAMGFSLPAAIGAAMASNGAPVVVIVGDGGLQVNIQELQTVARNRLPLKIVVLNNRCYGMVRQFQESYFEGRFQSTLIGYDAPDFARVAAAYGISSRRLDENELTAKDRRKSSVAAALEWLWNDPSEPALLEVPIAVNANAYPKLAFGRPITEMEPDASPLDMEGT